MKAKNAKERGTEKGAQQGKPIDLLLLGDKSFTLEALGYSLSAQTSFVVRTARAEKVVSLGLRGCKEPDVILLRLPLAQLDEKRTGKILNATFPKSRWIGWGERDDPVQVKNVWQAGGSGYLSQGCTLADVAEAVEQVCRGKRALRVPVLPDRLGAWLFEERAPEPDMSIAALSEQERRVVDLVGEGMLSKEIAHVLGLSAMPLRN